MRRVVRIAAPLAAVAWALACSSGGDDSGAPASDAGNDGRMAADAADVVVPADGGMDSGDTGVTTDGGDGAAEAGHDAADQGDSMDEGDDASEAGDGGDASVDADAETDASADADADAESDATLDGGGDGGVCVLDLSSQGLVEDPATCDACMAQSCCAEANVCATDQGCVALITCAANCEMDGGSPQQCGNICLQMYQGSQAHYASLMQCMQVNCSIQACFPLF
jgi:hypothetical protein